MNIKILKNYIGECLETGETPTFDGLKKYAKVIKK